MSTDVTPEVTPEVVITEEVVESTSVDPTTPTDFLSYLEANLWKTPEVPVPEEPTNFPADPVISDEDLNKISDYVDQLEQEHATSLSKVAEYEAKLADAVMATELKQAELDAKISEISKLQTDMKTIEDAWQKIVVHPELGPLTTKLVQGEEVHLSSMILDSLQADMAALPQTESTPPTPSIKAKVSINDYLKNHVHI